METAGTKVEENCPELPRLNECYRVLRGMLWAAGPGRAPQSVQEHFKATLTENIEFGKKLSIDDVYDSQVDRSILYDNMRLFLDEYDVLACPTVGLEAGLVTQEYPGEIESTPINDYIEWLRFSFLSTTTGLPSISIPVGFTQSGMPVGLQLIGPPRGEAKLLSIALAFENVLGEPLSPIDPVVTHI